MEEISMTSGDKMEDWEEFDKFPKEVKTFIVKLTNELKSRHEEEMKKTEIGIKAQNIALKEFAEDNTKLKKRIRELEEENKSKQEWINKLREEMSKRNKQHKRNKINIVFKYNEFLNILSCYFFNFHNFNLLLI